jgi:ATP/maltotriose-dependent transcriptional regulator MalT
MEEQPRSTDLRLIALAIRSGTFKPRPEAVQILEEIADYLDFLEESVLEELDKVPYVD